MHFSDSSFPSHHDGRVGTNSMTSLMCVGPCDIGSWGPCFTHQITKLPLHGMPNSPESSLVTVKWITCACGASTVVLLVAATL